MQLSLTLCQVCTSLSQCDVLVMGLSGFSRHAACLRQQGDAGLFLLRHGAVVPYSFR